MGTRTSVVHCSSLRMPWHRRSQRGQYDLRCRIDTYLDLCPPGTSILRGTPQVLQLGGAAITAVLFDRPTRALAACGGRRAGPIPATFTLRDRRALLDVCTGSSSPHSGQSIHRQRLSKPSIPDSAENEDLGMKTSYGLFEIQVSSVSTEKSG